MINQNESPFYTEEAFQGQEMHRRILETFSIRRVYHAHIPSYPSGHWGRVRIEEVSSVRC